MIEKTEIALLRIFTLENQGFSLDPTFSQLVNTCQDDLRNIPP